MKEINENKTIEELENHIWQEPSEFPTRLVKNIFKLRKKPIAELDGNDVRLLITQDVGIEFIIGRALALLSENILYEALYYPGDLLHAVLKIPGIYWKKNNPTLRRILHIMKRSNIGAIFLSDKRNEFEETLKDDFEVFLKVYGNM
ncbi:MAG: hypothetical protein HZA79_16935 [Sphingobacteriales bacterium]|nr:hypothetical protein [Sphingobacteriales bacterium]